MSGNSLEYEAFQRYIKGERLKIIDLISLLMQVVPSLLESLIRDIPGPMGMLLRRGYYKLRLSSLGKCTLIDVGVHFIGPRNISIGDYCWIDSNSKFEARLGKIVIGSRVHIASFVILGSREPIVICDFAAVGAGAKIYSNSETPKNGLRMSGPMIPEKDKAFYTIPITIGKDAVVGANSVLLPGANLGNGSILGSLSLLKDPIPDWEIWGGVPSKKIGVRQKVIDKI